MTKGFPAEVVYCQKQYDDNNFDFTIIILDKRMTEHFCKKLYNNCLLKRDEWKDHIEQEHGYEHFVTYPFSSGMNQLGFRKKKRKKDFIIK